MFGHQRLSKAAMLALITPAATSGCMRQHRAARPGSTRLISPKTSLPGRQRFGLFRPDRSRVRLLIPARPPRGARVFGGGGNGSRMPRRIDLPDLPYFAWPVKASKAFSSIA